LVGIVDEIERKRKEAEQAVAEEKARVARELQEESERAKRKLEEEEERAKRRRVDIEARLEAERLEVERIKADYTDKGQCAICMDRPHNTVCQPCLHASACSDCVPKLTTCPICRQRIESVLVIYRA
jgi:E3 ubiquitin-protein ligase MUL1